ncbi:TetR/AcrR family transcriptional regulator [Parapedomonas caeni]
MMPLSRPESASSARRRTQAERSDESERRLLDATVAVVAGEGVRAATFEAIGRVAGYSRGLATQKFGSKDGLIKALIADLHARQDALLTAHHMDDMPGLEAALGYADLYLRDLTENAETRAYFMLMAEAIADLSALRAAFAASHETVKQFLAGFIVRGQREGAIRAEVDPEAAALMIGTMLLGLSVQWLIDPTLDVARVRVASLETLRLAFAAPARRARG